MRSKLVVGVLASGLALSLGACSSGSETSASGSEGSSVQFEQKDPLKIGYSVYDLSNPYWAAYEAGVKAEAKAQGAEVVVADQKGSQQAQVSGSSDLINQGISALIVSPVEPSALPATVSAAHNAKIPVIVGDVGAEGDYDAFILSDNQQGGADAADYMAKRLGTEGSHKIGIITLHPGSDVGADRVDGFKKQIAQYSNIEVVSELNGNDAIKEGHDAAANMLAQHPDLAGIYAANDNEAQGAVAAIQEAGLDPKNVVVIGFDGSQGALDAIGQGTQAATVAQDPYGQGQLAVRTALQLLKGESVDYTDEENRIIRFPIELVESSNLAEFQAARAAQK
jgi:ribose transport system substrate-binding protein